MCRCRVAVVALIPVFLEAVASAAAAQSVSETPRGIFREAALQSGVLLTPGEIGRDINRAGGDVLVARVGDSPLVGARFEVRNRFVGAGADLLICMRRIKVRNEKGVDFPNHGESPLLYNVDARFYPFGKWSVAEHASPYIAVGLGGALLSVDLDNVDDQETRHLSSRSVGGGVKFLVSDGGMFLDVQVKQIHLAGRGPIRPFQIRSVIVGFGVWY